MDIYLASQLFKPFFYIVGEEYNKIKSELVSKDFDFLRLSDFCEEDTIPDFDKFIDSLKNVPRNTVVLGVGEYLSFEGDDKFSKLNELKDIDLIDRKVIFLLRGNGIGNYAKKMIASDLRLERQIFISKNCNSFINFVFSNRDIDIFRELKGFKKILYTLENGQGDILANTDICFPNSRFAIRTISNSYDAIKYQKYLDFDIDEKSGTLENWNKFLSDLNSCDGVKNLFEKYFDIFNINAIYQNITNADEYKNWLYFLYLKSLNAKSSISDRYLSKVIEISNTLNEFQDNILNYIIEIPTDDPNFKKHYKNRKLLVQQFNNNVSDFVKKCRVNIDENINKLTDNTLIEKEEIISYISYHGSKKCNLETIYPDLDKYLKKYNFSCGELKKQSNEDSTKYIDLSNLLTEYFDDYKHQKIKGDFYPDFIKQVEELAIERKYNILSPRDEILNSIEKEDSFLCFVDCLGVEYLSFISEYAYSIGLQVDIKIGRAKLPTITSMNRDFFDNWSEDCKFKENELDNVKHDYKNKYKSKDGSQVPKYLAEELNIIKKIIDEAKNTLNRGNFSNYILASDHGSSRIAVLYKKEEKYETSTQGEHSGRCCKYFPNCDLPFATEENGYIVLADYGRFKGSRSGNLEVHGGASLEEVVVPIIVLSKKDSSLEIRLVKDNDKNVVKIKNKNEIELEFYVSKPIKEKLNIKYEGNIYRANKKDESHYSITISGIKSGNYEFDLCLNNAKYSTIKVKAQKTVINKDFDIL